MKKLVYAMGALALWSALYYGTYVSFGCALLPFNKIWVNLFCAALVLLLFFMPRKGGGWLIGPKLVAGAGVAYAVGMGCLIFGSYWVSFAGFCIASLMRSYFSVIMFFVIGSFAEKTRAWVFLMLSQAVLTPLVVYFASGADAFIAGLVIVVPLCVGVLCACSIDDAAAYECLHRDKAYLGSRDALFLIVVLVAIHVITRIYLKQTFVFNLAAISLDSALPPVISLVITLAFAAFVHGKVSVAKLVVFAGGLVVAFVLSFPIGFALGIPNGGALSEGIVSTIGLAQRIALPLVIMFSRVPLARTFSLAAFASASFPWYDLADMLYITDAGRFVLSYSSTIAVVLVIAICAWFLFRHYERQSEDGSRDGAKRLLSLEEHHGLSVREREVFQLLIEGFSAQKIAEKLFISESTVRFHTTNIYRKFNVKTKQELLERIVAIKSE